MVGKRPEYSPAAVGYPLPRGKKTIGFANNHRSTPLWLSHFVLSFSQTNFCPIKKGATEKTLGPPANGRRHSALPASDGTLIPFPDTNNTTAWVFMTTACVSQYRVCPHRAHFPCSP